MSATITYTDIQFGFPHVDPPVFSPYSTYYNLTLDQSKPWLRAEILVNGNKHYTITHTDHPDNYLAINMNPVTPYPYFGIIIDGDNVYSQMYVYEATLRVYHTGDYTHQDIESWCPRTQMTYRD